MLSICTDPVVWLAAHVAPLWKVWYQSFSLAGILCIPDVSGKETEKERMLGPGAELETCSLQHHLNFPSANIFLKHLSFLSHRMKKKTPNLSNVKHGAKWCSVIFLTLKTAPYQLVPFSMHSRANAHQNVIDFAAAIAKNRGSFETRQEPSTSFVSENRKNKHLKYMWEKKSQ